MDNSSFETGSADWTAPPIEISGQQIIRDGVVITPYVFRGKGRVVTTLRWFDAAGHLLSETIHGERETVPMSVAPDGAIYWSAVMRSEGLPHGETHYIDR